VALLSRVLVLNAGSSSLKASVVEAAGSRTPLAATQVAWGSDATRVANRAATVARALDELWSQGVGPGDLIGSGHRIVHGGPRFRAPLIVDDAILADLGDLAAYAPLHNSVAVDTLRAVMTVVPGLPAVAVFDSAFHATLPAEAFVYPLPWPWYEEWGIRRYGFHGLSVAWSVRRAEELLDRAAGELDLVVAHLGSGCSVTAVAHGRSVSTSMGMTPLEGLAMGTRSGSVDPGILLHLVRERGMSLDELAETLDHASGLLGMSGVSGDVREVQQAAEAGSERARVALDVFVRRAAESIAAAATSLSRIDGIVFTGGIGEHAAHVRRRICDHLAILGVPPVDARATPADVVLSAPGESPAVLRVEAREDLVIAESAARELPARS
jgi:acetate kinase